MPASVTAQVPLRPGAAGDDTQMVSFNHGVSSLTRKGRKVKYNLRVLLCAAAARAPPRHSPARAPPHSCGVEGSILETNSRLSPTCDLSAQAPAGCAHPEEQATRASGAWEETPFGVDVGKSPNPSELANTDAAF